jgi:6-pyruvoyltetrahydropterin/6-carboxytetrahydropterin synthase
VIWNKLRVKMDEKFDLEVVLYETARNFVTIRGTIMALQVGDRS